MNVKLIGLLGLLVLLTPAAVRAQTASQPDPVVRAERTITTSAQMYEDIEVMRRILRTKLLHYGSTVIVTDVAKCTSCHSPTTHGMGIAGADFVDDNDGRPDLLVTKQDGLLKLFRNTGEGKFDDVTQQSGLHDVHSLLTSRPVRSLDIEGVYLKGQGVVYTVTMPPPRHDPRPGATPVSDKPLSDWDRARKEVRNEKPTPEQSKQPPKEPALADIILKVLADNGKHFSLLKPDETLTVAVTFRRGTVEPLAVFHDVLDSVGQAPASGGGKGDPNQQLSTGNKPATTARDHLLLGDLHLRQGKPLEAITSYQKAVELNPELLKEPSLLERMAQARMAQGLKDQANELLVGARKLREDALVAQAKNTQAGESSPAPLPAKLIISAPKKLLDQVGNGQISFDAFKERASVEYLTFPTQVPRSTQGK